jgi:acetyl esterase/lipase
MNRVLLFFVFSLSALYIQAKGHLVYKDIPYVPVTSESYDERHVLDIYTPRTKINTSSEVVVFIHGGRWKMGSKDMFNYVGINFAEKGKTAVLINYRLTPNVMYDDMAMDCAKAIKWVLSQIEYYGGDTSKIFLYGHSSGGHLAALVSTNNRFFDSLGIAPNPIKGCVLIDAFGMNMYNYLRKPRPEYNWMFDTFSRDEEKWKDASPALFVTEQSPSFLMFLGAKTFNIIYHDAKSFDDMLEKKGISATLIVMNKRKHMEMIAQMINPQNEIYSKCIEFMKDY